MFSIGSKVKIAEEGLKIHSRSIPASAGYTSAAMKWRNDLLALKQSGAVGIVTRVFVGSTIPTPTEYNVDFEGTCYGLPPYMVAATEEEV